MTEPITSILLTFALCFGVSNIMLLMQPYFTSKQQVTIFNFSALVSLTGVLIALGYLIDSLFGLL